MHAHGVEVLHVADGDHVALAVAHHLVLDLFPAGDALLDQHLMDGRQAQTVGADLAQLGLVLTDAAAGAAHGEGGAHDHGVVDLLSEGQSVVQVLHHLAGDAGLAQLLHGVLEQLPVLGAVDGLGLAAQQTHALGLQEAFPGQGHGHVQAGLAAQVGQDGVRLFLLDDALDDLGGHGLHIHPVGDVGVGHDGGGVGVDQHHLHALFLQGAAGLGAGVVKLGGLADDNGAGAQHQHLFDIGILRHGRVLPSCCPQSGQTDTRCPWGRGRPPGGTGR